MAKQPRLPQTSQCDGAQPSSAAPEYVIGYRRPPVHSRYKPGQCGNPRGRPKRQRNVRTVVEETLNQRIKVREGDRTRSLTKLDGVVLTMVAGALKGDPKALASLMSLLRSVGMTAEAPAAIPREPLTSDDEAMIADFLGRQGNQVVAPTQPPESTEHPEPAETKTASQQSKETRS
jgi:uncharacterized protein DUF5681